VSKQIAELTRSFGCRYPIFGFSHTPDVVAAVTLAGGVGVLGALGMDGTKLEHALRVIEDKVGELPYGVDIVIPAKRAPGNEEIDFGSAASEIPQTHWDFTEELLQRHGVPPVGASYERRAVGAVGLSVDSEARDQLEIALAHKARVIVNALGPPPPYVVDTVHERGRLVGALVGSVNHVERQLNAGVDLVVAQGTEAGGHTGEIATMVLLPEVVRVVADRVPVLAAGGIGSGAQIVAAHALGAAGVWTGTLWLMSEEGQDDIDPATRSNLRDATSADTVRSRAMSGKPMRQLRTAWTQAWDGPESPGCLPAPYQGVIHHSTAHRFRKAQARPLCGYAVGQVIGQLHELRTVETIVRDLAQEVRDCLEDVGSFASGAW
jgi:NAD(P)H-dependent flavin oxidoreductase YrpB (nitropropane dioxygenase family)